MNNLLDSAYQRTNRIVYQIVCLFIVLTIAASNMVLIAQAAPKDVGAPSSTSDIWMFKDLNGDSIELNQLKAKAEKIFDLFVTVSSAASAVALAGLGLMLAIGVNQRNTESILTKMKYLIVAIAGLQLLPLIIMAGIKIGLRYSWNPSNPIS